MESNISYQKKASHWNTNMNIFSASSVHIQFCCKNICKGESGYLSVLEQKYKLSWQMLKACRLQIKHYLNKLCSNI